MRGLGYGRYRDRSRAGEGGLAERDGRRRSRNDRGVRDRGSYRAVRGGAVSNSIDIYTHERSQCARARTQHRHRRPWLSVLSLECSQAELAVAGHAMPAEECAEMSINDGGCCDCLLEDNREESRVVEDGVRRARGILASSPVPQRVQNVVCCAAGVLSITVSSVFHQRPVARKELAARA